MVSKVILWVLIISGLYGIGSAMTPNKDCITLHINYGILGEPTTEECIPWVDEVKATDFLKNNKFTIEGTRKYGEGILCRLNGLPSAKKPIGIPGHESYIEKCKTMPEEFAYWAVLEKRKQAIPNPLDLNGKYQWSSVAINQLTLKPGDSLALVFSDNGNVKFP